MLISAALVESVRRYTASESNTQDRSSQSHQLRR